MNAGAHGRCVCHVYLCSGLFLRCGPHYVIRIRPKRYVTDVSEASEKRYVTDVAVTSEKRRVTYVPVPTQKLAVPVIAIHPDEKNKRKTKQTKQL